ncbi:unnamed protein product [Clonostachys rosea f. rosea IK726]|uniref:Uncharacterized protein n=1 Tax=Clonostachys rosea f. rosea IK726 TaxID=1349383 RepID=A0ACA9UHP3_BIOOC|nr:unnamed protein product [Clonostachys rosea f. rosea IK726]
MANDGRSDEEKKQLVSLHRVEKNARCTSRFGAMSNSMKCEVGGISTRDTQQLLFAPIRLARSSPLPRKKYGKRAASTNDVFQRLAQDEGEFTLGQLLSHDPPILKLDDDLTKGQERQWLVVRSSTFQRSELQHMFSRAVQMKQIGRQGESGYTTRKVQLCLTPASVFYDEFHNGKSENSQTVHKLLQLGSEPSLPHQRRMLFLGLSGTPTAAKGPADLIGIAPVLRRTEPGGSRLMERIRHLQSLYSTVSSIAQKRSVQENTELNDDELYARDIWPRRVVKTLGRYIISRRVGEDFLGTKVAGCETTTHTHDPIICSRPEQYSSHFQNMTATVHEKLQELRQGKDHSIAEANVQRRLVNTGVFLKLYRCTILPPLAALLQPPEQGERTFPYLADQVAKDISLGDRSVIMKRGPRMDCEQLQHVSRLIDQGRRANPMDHFLVLTPAPVLAAMVYSWLRHCRRSSSPAQSDEGLTLILADRATDHAALLKELGEMSRIGIHVVVISTFDLMAEGWNGLVFANRFIKLGEPFTNRQTIQGQGRLNRRGQVKEVHLFGIHGEGLDAAVAERNASKSSVLNLDRILKPNSGARAPP